MRKVLVVACFVQAARAVCGPLYEPMTAPFTTWVANGKALARIVSDAFPEDAVRPANLLNEYVEKMTGVRLPVVERANGEGPTIFLGPKSGLGRLGKRIWEDIGPEGFVIATVGQDLVIAGKNRLATTYGVYAFLEECLGVRWLWADETGEYCPRLSELRVGQVHKVENPDFRLRWVGRGEWALANRMNVNIGHPDEFKTKWFVHTFLDLVPPEKYWQQHPEYYAERGGKRQDPRDPSRQVQLCTSNPAVAEAVAQTIDQLVHDEPSIRMISVDPMDSQNFCECERCRALDEKDAPYAGRHSRRLVLFYNRVAELVAQKYPDLLLKSIAYWTYVAPPADPSIKVRDNVVIQFCRFQCHNHALDDLTCPDNRDYNLYFKGWKKIAPNIALYEYYWKVSWLHLPWPIVHTLERDLPYLRNQGVMGVASQYTTNFATNGLAYYVAAKLLWDADLDVEALLEDFYQKAYGEAAGPMAEYHERLERAAIESGVHMAHQRPYAQVLQVFTPEVLRDLDKAIEKAKAVVRDEQARRRVAMMAQGLEYTHMVVDYLRTIDEVRRKAPQSLWVGGVTAEVKAEGVRRAASKAEAIARYIGDPATSPAVGRSNGYIESMLKPDLVLGAWSDAAGSSGAIRLTKAQWLKDHRQMLSFDIPERFDLWVYGNDLDFVEGKAEHTIIARTPGGTEVVIGHLGTASRPGDGVNRCYILRNLKRELVAGKKLMLVIANDEGGPYASRFWALYVMPAELGVDEDTAQGLIETHIESVRRQALGFVEYDFYGLANNDNDRDAVEIAIEGTPLTR